ncbi:hypothetical protein N7444_011606 [Penicillium canescens]|nr:hypothetical protein N7444_011606 [Penicillium canescens]KAJ6176767.1 hypothetical protein N7485_003681 [Penicillium canescens]
MATVLRPGSPQALGAAGLEPIPNNAPVLVSDKNRVSGAVSNPGFTACSIKLPIVPIRNATFRVRPGQYQNLINQDAAASKKNVRFNDTSKKPACSFERIPLFIFDIKVSSNRPWSDLNGFDI